MNEKNPLMAPERTEENESKKILLLFARGWATGEFEIF
jgi:hypothetical protein